MRRAFTLIESLVAIGVIALLLALLLPTLAGARRAGRDAACLSNLRQMSAAALLYADAHRGRLPMAWFVDDAGVTVAWDLTVRDGRLEPGLLWQGDAPPGVGACPAFAAETGWAGDNWGGPLDDPYVGYNLNASHLAGEPGRPPARLSRVAAPSGTAAFGDGQWANGANKFMRAPRHAGTADGPVGFRHAGTQGFRHGRGRTQVGFLDGRAAGVAERGVDFDLYAGPGPPSLVGEGCGFLGEGNAMYDLE